MRALAIPLEICHGFKLLRQSDIFIVRGWDSGQPWTIIRGIFLRDVHAQVLILDGIVFSFSSSGAWVACGVMYTALNWFLEQSNPSKKQCAHPTLCCHEGAVEFEGAHVRALSGTAFAKAPSAYPKPLCLVRNGSERQRLGNEAVDTEIAF